MNTSLRQMLVFVLDAYRQLRSQKLFWFASVISIILPAFFGFFIINQEGIQFFTWEFKSSVFNANLLNPAVFYKQVLFMQFGIDTWLTFIAMILAIATTSGIFPDFLSSGSIYMCLSRPLSRLKLFSLRYLSGLSFVALQVTLFTATSFIVIGLRTTHWEWGLFIAIPLIVLLFSYFFSFSTLLAFLGRSSQACTLMTLVFWALLSILGTVEHAFLEDKIDLKHKQISLESNQGPVHPQDKSRIEKDYVEENNVYQTVHNIRTFLPKTQETSDLIKRYIIDAANLNVDENHFLVRLSGGVSNRGHRATVLNDLEQTKLKEPVWWILGTSLGFELVILSLSAFIFCRRDF